MIGFDDLPSLFSNASSPGEAIRAVRERLGDRSAMDLDKAEDPHPMDTLGNLVDKLCTVDLKMWNNQEALYAIRRMTPEEFTAKFGADMAGLHAIIKRCCDLNVQRSMLMDEIDRFLKKAVEGRIEGISRPQHKTY